MCLCNPNIKTPYCGAAGCTKQEEESTDTIASLTNQMILLQDKYCSQVKDAEETKKDLWEVTKQLYQLEEAEQQLKQNTKKRVEND